MTTIKDPVIIGTSVRIKLVDLRDVTGAVAANATCSCVVQAPTGPTSLGAPTNDGNGSYHWDYLTDETGPHWSVVTVSAPFALVEQHRFVVVAAAT